MADNFFTEIQLPQQKHYNSVPIPSVLTPTKQYSVSHLIEAIKKQKPFLESLILKSGAILLRGFDVQNAKEFNDVIEAFGYEEFPMIGGTALRNHVYARVYSANDSPPEQQINFHHEMSQAPVSPSKIIFFCETAPKSGGETAIAWSHIIYERMKEKHPEFVEKLEKHGMIYWRVLEVEDDYSTLSGRSWKSMYGTDDKALAEERAAKLGIKFEWLEDGRVKRSTNPIPTIRYDKVRQRKVWFTTMVGWEVAGTDPLKAMNFGDGSPLPADICDDCLEILEEEGVFIPWQEGDILVIDNTAVLHSRRPSKPPRRVLASLCK